MKDDPRGAALTTAPGGLVPTGLTALLSGRGASGGPDGNAWLRALPGLVNEAFLRWSLVIDRNRPTRHGACALVVPVRRSGTRADVHGSPAILKVTWPHPAAANEHLALRAWAGRRAVRLLAADPTSWSMLLEPLDPDRDLLHEPIESACTVIGELLANLAVPAPGWATPLSAKVESLLERLSPGPSRAAAVRGSLPRRFLEQARSLATDLLADGTAAGTIDATLVHADLHYQSVLAGRTSRGWVAIAAAPLAAEPAYGVWPALYNRWQELRAEATTAAALRWEIHRRLASTCAAAELDEDRARSWAIVRSVANGLSLAERDATRGTETDLTGTVTLLKALQPW